MNPLPSTPTRGVELQQIWLLLRKGWYLLLSGLLVGYVASSLYLRYAAYEYEAAAVLQVNSDNLSQGFGFGSLQVNEEGGLGGGSGGVDIIRSKQVLSNVIEKLKLQTAYSSIGRVRSSSLYGGSVPIRVVFDSLHFTLYNRAYEVNPGPTEGTFDFRPAGSSAE
ncbi:MAG: Wzz/FepE/Etk N-terminal domain-containing protein, partial [Bacteroidia bacterium]|nr:Wzz/FepE/Etk N-terminal domain-containing protein [Bacteroidia bacterium]